MTPNKPARINAYKPEVWSSSDSLDIDDVLATPLESLDSETGSQMKMPLPVPTEQFNIKLNRNENRTRRVRNENTPNTVSITRRTVPVNRQQPTNRYSSPAHSKR